MKWYIDNIEFDNAGTCADYIMENCGSGYFDEMLDECYPDIEICGYTYSPSFALYMVDEIAYNCARNDWGDAEASDIAYQLERMDDGEVSSYYGFSVECVDNREDEED